MEIKEYQAAIEAILFACAEPLPLPRLAEALELDEETTAHLAQDLMQDINTRTGGIRMVCLDGAYQLCTNTAYAAQVRRAQDLRRNAPLSQAALEVLAIVAYNQPVTRAFVEQVRGVDCGAVLQGLISKALVEEKGRLELPGRPLIYGTTPDFLRSFGLSSLEQLPPLPTEEQQGSTMIEMTLDDVVEQAEKEALQQSEQINSEAGGDQDGE